MGLLSEGYPHDFSFHPHWKGGGTHPAVFSRRPIVDPLGPGSTGGNWRELDNLVASCWPCNSRKADFTLGQPDWELREPADPRWDGLARYIPRVVARGRSAQGEVPGRCRRT